LICTIGNFLTFFLGFFCDTLSFTTNGLFTPSYCGSWSLAVSWCNGWLWFLSHHGTW